jgi:hypothetical protein
MIIGIHLQRYLVLNCRGTYGRGCPTIWFLPVNISISSLVHTQQFRPERIYLLKPAELVHSTHLPQRKWLTGTSNNSYVRSQTILIKSFLSLIYHSFHIFPAIIESDLKYMRTESEFFARKPAVLKSRPSHWLGVCLIASFLGLYLPQNWMSQFLFCPQFHHTSRVWSPSTWMPSS